MLTGLDLARARHNLPINRYKGSAMSNLEDRVYARNENPFAEKYARAMASIETEKRNREASGYAWMAAAMSYGEAAQGPSRFGKVARGAKWFVLWFSMLLPSLLVIHVAF
jgi:hypothetical protein